MCVRAFECVCLCEGASFVVLLAFQNTVYFGIDLLEVCMSMHVGGSMQTVYLCVRFVRVC